MYYLSKFCRICIAIDAELKDLESEDEDGITFNEKLALCTKMVNIMTFILFQGCH